MSKSDQLARRLHAVGLGSLGLIAVASCTARLAAANDAPLALELAAARSILASYRPAVITVDPEYVRPTQAPPSPAGRQRPDDRQRALTDSLRGNTVGASGDTLRVRISEPVIQGRSATISVTVDGSLAGGHPGSFYETIVLELQQTGDKWVVRKRSQLGIS